MLSRLVATRCIVDKPFLYNQCFRGSVEDLAAAASGLLFPDNVWSHSKDATKYNDPEPVSTVYATVCGPSVASTALIYAETNYNISRAFERLSGLRVPDKFITEDLHKSLESAGTAKYLTEAIRLVKYSGREIPLEFAYRANQAKFIREHGHIVVQHYGAHYVELYTGDALQDELEHYADPHVKRGLRVHTFKESLIKGTWLAEPRTRHVLAKFKIEMAKPGRLPRQVIDLQCPASLMGAWLAKNIKATQEVILELPTVHLMFVPGADYKSLKRAFDFLASATLGSARFIFFSDDSCLSWVDDQGWHCCDIDISSCDKSHTHHLFDLLIDATPTHRQEQMRMLVEQLKAPIIVRSQDKVLKRKYTPKYPMLYSGSSLTTLVNNLANTLIGIAIGQLSSICVQGIVEAAASAGYIVTVVLHHRFEEVQFLKHSPAKDLSGVYQPLQNFGPFLRGTGTTVGDLPGRGAILDRAIALHSARLTCTWPNAHFPILDKARHKYAPAADPSSIRLHEIMKKRVLRDREQTSTDGWPHLHFTNEAALSRYSASDIDIAAVDRVLSGSPFVMYSYPFLGAVLHKDYELSLNLYPYKVLPIDHNAHIPQKLVVVRPERVVKPLQWVRDLTHEGVEPNPGPVVATHRCTPLTRVYVDNPVLCLKQAGVCGQLVLSSGRQTPNQLWFLFKLLTQQTYYPVRFNVKPGGIECRSWLCVTHAPIHDGRHSAQPHDAETRSFESLGNMITPTSLTQVVIFMRYITLLASNLRAVPFPHPWPSHHISSTQLLEAVSLPEPMASVFCPYDPYLEPGRTYSPVRLERPLRLSSRQQLLIQAPTSLPLTRSPFHLVPCQRVPWRSRLPALTDSQTSQARPDALCAQLVSGCGLCTLVLSLTWVVSTYSTGYPTTNSLSQPTMIPLTNYFKTHELLSLASIKLNESSLGRRKSRPPPILCSSLGSTLEPSLLVPTASGWCSWLSEPASVMLTPSKSLPTTKALGMAYRRQSRILTHRSWHRCCRRHMKLGCLRERRPRMLRRP